MRGSWGRPAARHPVRPRAGRRRGGRRQVAHTFCCRSAGLYALVQVQLPQYVDYVKTGAFKELAPLDPDWYYIRAGALRTAAGSLLAAAFRSFVGSLGPQLSVECVCSMRIWQIGEMELAGS